MTKGNENVVIKKAVMLNSFQHLHLSHQFFKAEEILNQVQDDNIKTMTRGFTLIELLVVVLIIAILAAVALPQYQKAVLKSRYRTVTTIVDAIVRAEDAYYLEHGSHPTTIDELEVSFPNGTVNPSNANNIVYSWGSCNLYPDEGDERVNCDTERGIGYTRRFLHTASHAGRACIARISHDIANSICKEETGQPSASGSTTTLNWYWYR